MFGKGYKMTLNRVHDRVTVKEGGERLTLTVDGDAMRMVAGLNKAQEKMKALTEESTDGEIREAAEYFASVLFGSEQARKLMEFYADDAGSVIAVCGKYFRERLADKISAQQKKLNV